ncbi:hypothetical protein SYNPS1DRAFT_27923 [Syncephalis pseudoplumigaleata]|uniref:DH domain-containing protein n=1 Tax=Syncephalis pseudoplumigaleata TaxID=1712513 RepID=A0A4P9Z336_9FUNG|nr:hypothetical protein SYNPS1DRAFT_27923 [Syncephalis pseudoplumigaleata]|eukprot:RKP26382.1 hypothetical protein SYNPS1DRAFT_27923 [Syncephalis pseudoplumigaleata]
MPMTFTCLPFILGMLCQPSHLDRTLIACALLQSTKQLAGADHHAHTNRPSFTVKQKPKKKHRSPTSSHVPPSISSHKLTDTGRYLLRKKETPSTSILHPSSHIASTLHLQPASPLTCSSIDGRFRRRTSQADTHYYRSITIPPHLWITVHTPQRLRKLAMLNTPTVPYYPVEYTVYPDGKQSQGSRTPRVTAAYYGTAVAATAVARSVSPLAPLASEGVPAASAAAAEKPKHRTPQLLARGLEQQPACLPPLKLRDHKSLSKTAQRLSIGLSMQSKAAQNAKAAALIPALLDSQQPTLLQRRRNLQTGSIVTRHASSMLYLNCDNIHSKLAESSSSSRMPDADAKSRDAATPALSPSLASAPIPDLATQIAQMVAAEEAYLRRLELIRDAYWKPLGVRYPLQEQSGTTGKGVLCSVAWSSTSDEESEGELASTDGEQEEEEEGEDAEMAANEFSERDEVKSVSTLFSSSMSTCMADDDASFSGVETVFDGADTFIDIEIDDPPALPATIATKDPAASASTSASSAHAIKPRTSSLANIALPRRDSSMAAPVDGVSFLHSK